tara:strand:+ start:2630 stop:3703 length:1074 start_codon:yes stop_codon:yes gene_type:complete
MAAKSRKMKAADISVQQTGPADTTDKYNSTWGKYWQIAGLHVCDDQDGDGYLDKDIFFGLRITGAPDAQLVLRSNIDRTLSALKSIYALDNSSVQRYTENRSRFDDAFYKLLSLAQLGMATKHADPYVANAALTTLKAEIVDREASRIKNDHMRKLGLWALVPALVCGILYLLYDEFIYWPDEIQHYRHIFLVWIGCLAGTWVSFAARKVVLTFEDLSTLEKDRLDPPMRLIFTAMITTFFILIFTTGLINLEIGGFSSASILTSGSVALLIGALLGLSEQALPAVIMDRADNFMTVLSSSVERGGEVDYVNPAPGAAGEDTAAETDSESADEDGENEQDADAAVAVNVKSAEKEKN